LAARGELLIIYNPGGRPEKNIGIVSGIAMCFYIGIIAKPEEFRPVVNWRKLWIV
jgi:hypothetical protein